CEAARPSRDRASAVGLKKKSALLTCADATKPLWHKGFVASVPLDRRGLEFAELPPSESPSAWSWASGLNQSGSGGYGQQGGPRRPSRERPNNRSWCGADSRPGRLPDGTNGFLGPNQPPSAGTPRQDRARPAAKVRD